MTKRRLRVVAIQHLDFEDLGSFEEVLHDRGMDMTYLQAGVDEISRPLLDADIAVVLGGPIGVYESDAYPFLTDELNALGQRLSANRPTLGICLGAQLMAQALGGRVYPGGHKEIGWSPLVLNEAAPHSPLQHLQDTPVLHWHGDTFDLPLQAEWLAASAQYRNQAFRVGNRLLALQFHPEAQASKFERWLIGHATELSGAKVDVGALRAQAAAMAPALERAGKRMLESWLDGLG